LRKHQINRPHLPMLHRRLGIGSVCVLVLLACAAAPAHANPVPYGPLDPLPGFWMEAGPILFEAILLGALLGLRWYLVLPAALVANTASFFVVPLLLMSTPLASLFFGGLAVSWLTVWLLTVLIEAPVFSAMLTRRIPFGRSIRRVCFVCFVSVVIMDVAWMLSMNVYHSIARGGQ